MDTLRQILNPHITIKIGIFGVQIRQHIFNAQIKIITAFEIGQTTHHAHGFGLINANADLNAKNKFGSNALILATYNHCTETVLQLLINAKADVNAKNKDGYTALDKTFLNDQLEIAQMLIDAGADFYETNLAEYMKKNGDIQ